MSVSAERLAELTSLDYFFVDEAYRAWTGLVASVAESEWWLPMGPVAGAFAESDRVVFVMHIMDELIHHGAEVALLRDLYRARADPIQGETR